MPLPAQPSCQSKFQTLESGEMVPTRQAQRPEFGSHKDRNSGTICITQYLEEWGAGVGWPAV